MNQNQRTELILDGYKPKLGLIVYSSTLGNGYYLESHDIDADGKILAGKPLLQETLQAVVDVFFDERKNMQRFKGILPANLLYFDQLPGGQYRMIWYRPAEVRVLHFAPSLKLSTSKAWVPAMVYAVTRNDLHVYALDNDDRPSPESQLFLAPFFNVSDTGDVCLGSAKVKKPSESTYAAIMKYWEDLFWLSEFTHLNGNSKTNTADLASVWRKLLGKTRKKWSDFKELKPYAKNKLKNLENL